VGEDSFPCATENRAGLQALSLESCEGPGRPDKPTCGHTDKEQALVLFPATSQNKNLVTQ